MLVPSPAFRSMALGIMLSGRLRARRDADPAAGGASEARAAGRPARRCPGCTPASTARARFAALGRAALAPPAHLRRSPRSRCSSLLALPVLGLKTGMPSIKVVPEDDGSRVGYDAGAAGVRPRRARARCRSSRPRADAAAAAAAAPRDPGIARVAPPAPGGGGLVLLQAIPSADPVEPGASARTIDRLRDDAPARRARRRRGGREPRPRAGARGQDAARDRRRARARLPAPARRPPGAADRGRSASSPTCSPSAPPSASRG